MGEGRWRWDFFKINNVAWHQVFLSGVDGFETSLLGLIWTLVIPLCEMCRVANSSSPPTLCLT